MQHPYRLWKAAAAFVLGVQVAAAQTTLTVPPTVTPGSSVAAIVTGPPGQFFAVIGSAVNSGMSYGGIALGVGTDFVILAHGVLDNTGQATVAVTPPFDGTTLDRYYVQAGTSPSPIFLPLSVSPRRVVLNADLVTGLIGPPGPQGSPGPPGLAGISGGTSVVVSAFLTACPLPGDIVGSLPITLSSSSKVFSIAQGTYYRNGTALEAVRIRVLLRNSANMLVASSGASIASLTSPVDNAYKSVVAAAVLKIPYDPGGYFVQGADYVAAPGTYTLQLVAEATTGTCPPPGLLPTLDGTLTYLLVGVS